MIFKNEMVFVISIRKVFSKKYTICTVKVFQNFASPNPTLLFILSDWETKQCRGWDKIICIYSLLEGLKEFYFQFLDYKTFIISDTHTHQTWDLRQNMNNTAVIGALFWIQPRVQTVVNISVKSPQLLSLLITSG